MALITPQTGSIIENANGSNRTGTALSTHIVIRVGPNPVGAIQTIEVREERTVTPVDEVGTDGHIDSAPTRSTNISGTCRRVRYDRLRVAEAFSRGFLHAKSQRIPFNIDIFDKWNGDNENMIVTTIKNVWITGIDYSYAADNWIITDNMSWMAEDISSSIQGTGNAATGGARGLILQTDTAGIEARADRGLLRGALDSSITPNSGLINAVFGNF
jgi:hypothetical protein